MSFTDIFYQPGDAPVFCYRSGKAVYEETFFRGCLVASGRNAAGYPLNVLSNCPTRLNPDDFAEPSVFSIEADGNCLDYDWKFVDFSEEKSDSGIEAVLTLDSGISPLRVKLHTVLDGTQTFTRFIEIENRSEKYISVGGITLLGGGFEQMDEINMLTDETDVTKYYSCGYFEDDRWGGEGSFRRHALAPEKLTVDCRFNRGRHRHPAIFIQNNLLGTVTEIQTGWSGGCGFTLDYNANVYRRETKLSYKVTLEGYSPLIVLRPKETFTLPEVHFGTVHGGLDDMVNDMNAHIRRSVLNEKEADPSACLIGCGMGAEHDMMPDTTLHFIDQFAEMGGEIFIIDAGWECPPGNPIDWGGCNGRNVPDPERYKDVSLDEIREYCHKKGLKFALWVEIERLGRYCPAFTEHPEWRAEDKFGRQTGGYLDMTVPEAAAWAENEAARIIEEYKPELFRVDYNVDNRDYFLMRDTCGSGRKECLALRQFNAVYGMYRRLKKRFPDVIFENCAGGGGRTDLGQMKAFHHTWVSDWQQAPRSLMITNGMTLVLPPERVDRLFAGMGCHPFGSLETQMRNTMLCHMSLNVISPAAARINPETMAFVKHSVSVYKEKIRPILPGCLVFHHTPESMETLKTGVSMYEIASPDRTRGALSVFTTCQKKPDEKTIVVYPKGIDASFTYDITLDNSGSTFPVSGRELLNGGLRITVPSSLGSELVLYEQAGGSCSRKN